MEDKHKDTDSNIASKRLLDAAGIQYRPFKKIRLTLETE